MWNRRLCVLLRVQAAVVASQHAAPCPSSPAFGASLLQADLLAFRLPVDLPAPRLVMVVMAALRMRLRGVIGDQGMCWVCKGLQAWAGRARSGAVTQQWLILLRPVAHRSLGSVPCSKLSVRDLHTPCNLGTASCCACREQ